MTGATVEVIQLLLDSDIDMRTIDEKGHRGRVPIQSACYFGRAPVEVIQVLLQASIRDRMRQLSLDQGEVGAQELINAMSGEDSKTE
jgi:ankyrin repeat protein